MATALDKDSYQIYWLASDCETCIGGITDAGVLETLAGFSIDIDFTTGNAITVDINAPLAADEYVYGLDVDIQQTAAFAAGTWSTSGGLMGVRSDVHVDYKITEAYAGYFNVYIDPDATCTLNDMLGVFGRVVLVGPVTAGAATSQVAALRGSISNSSTGSYDGQVFALSLDFGSNVNYGSTTAMIYAWTHGDSRCDYGFYLNNYSPYMTTGIYLSETAGDSPAMTTAIHVDASCTTGIDIGTCTTGIELSGTYTKAINIANTVAAPNIADGVGTSGSFVSTGSGTFGGHFTGAASWVNIADSAVTGAYYVCAQHNGIYEGSATLTNTKVIFGLRMSQLCTNFAVAKTVCPFSLNTSNNGITALFDCATNSDLGRITDAGSDAGYLVPLSVDNGGNISYIKLYNQA